MSASQATPSDWRKPTSAPGRAPGTMTWRSRSRAGQAQGRRGLAQVGVDAAQRGDEVQVERDDDAERDERDLRRLADPEPEDEERHEAEQRQRAEHLHRRVDDRVAGAAEARRSCRGRAPRRCRAPGPASARRSETSSASGSSPVCTSSHAVPRIAVGASSVFGDRTPVVEASCQRASRASGLSQRRAEEAAARAGRAGTRAPRRRWWCSGWRCSWRNLSTAIPHVVDLILVKTTRHGTSLPRPPRLAEPAPGRLTGSTGSPRGRAAVGEQVLYPQSRPPPTSRCSADWLEGAARRAGSCSATASGSSSATRSPACCGCATPSSRGGLSTPSTACCSSARRAPPRPPPRPGLCLLPPRRPK